MPKYLSGRVKLRDQSNLSADRYRYLALDQAEPNLGIPPLGGSPDIPIGDQYQIISIIGDDNEVNRYWIPVGGGIIPGSLSVFDEGTLVGGVSSTTQLDVRGLGVAAVGSNTGQPNPGVAVTITVRPPGANGSVLFKASDDFATSSDLVFNSNVGILTVGKGLNVGIGSTVLNAVGVGTSSMVGVGTVEATQNLHVQGNIRLTGTIYDHNNLGGSPSDILLRTAYGVEWTTNSSVRSGAGGTLTEMQFHGAAGLVDGADNFVYIKTAEGQLNRVGIGSTQPRNNLLMDVVGVASFSNIHAGIATIGISTIESLRVTGVSTFNKLTDTRLVFVGTGSTLVDSSNLTFDGSTVSVTGTVNSTNLAVSGVGTIGNVKISGQKVNTTTGNLVLDSAAGLVQIDDSVYITSTDDSINFATGALIVQGGASFDKNVNVGTALSVSGPTDPTGVGVTLCALGGITTTGGDLYIGGDLYVEDDVVFDEGNFQRLIVNPGVSTFHGPIVAKSHLDVTGISTFADNIFVGTGATVGFGTSAFFSDDAGTIFGAGHDLRIYHKSSDSNNYIESVNGNLLIQNDNDVNIGKRDGSTISATFNTDDAVFLNFNGASKFKTTNLGVEVTGTVTDDGATHDGDVNFQGVNAGVTSAYWDKSDNNFKFVDNSKLIFGDGSDLEIYHDSDGAEPNSIIEHSNSSASALYLKSNQRVEITDENAVNLSLRFNNTGSYETELFHGSTRRFATTGTGVSIYGGLLDKDGELGTNGQLLQSTGTAIDWVSVGDLTTVNANKVGIGSTDISLTSEFGAAGIGTYYLNFVQDNNPHNARENEYLYNSNELVYDVLQNRVGVGTTRPRALLHLYSNGPILRFTDANAGANETNWNISANLNRHLRFQAIDDSTLNNGDGSGGGNLFDFYRTENNIDEFRGVGAGNTWFTIDNRTYITHVLGNVGIGTTDVDVEVGVANTGILAAGIVTAHTFRGGDYYGTFKGDIDPGVPITNALNINITDDTTGSGTHYIHFGSETSGYDGVEVDSTDLVYKDRKFGIGTNDPSGMLEVQKNGVPAIISNYNNSKHVQIDVGNDGGGFQVSTGNHFAINHQPYADRGTNNNLTERFRITPTGDVGIGTTNPIADNIAASLQINNNVLAVGIVTAKEYYGTFKGTIDSSVEIATDKIMELDTSAEVVDSGSDGHFKVITDNVEKLRILADGKVGINSIDPQFDLDIVNNSNSYNNDTSLRLYNNDTGSSKDTVMRFQIAGTNSSNYIYFGDCEDTNAGQIVYAHGDDSMRFFVNSPNPAAAGERLRITSSGDVGIGTNVPTDEVGIANTAVLAVGIVTAYKLYGDGSNITGVSGGDWNQDAQGNLTAGLDAGKCLTTNSVYNIFAGENSGSSVDTGDSNIFLGHSAGNNTTSGSYNIFLGCYSGSKNVGGAYNIAFGDRAGCCLGSGNDNIFIGRCSGRLATGVYNTFFGSMSGCTLVSGCHNVHIGYKAGHDQTAGCCNVIIGSSVVTPPPTTNDNSRLAIGNPGGVWIQGDGSFNVGIGTYVPTDEAHVSNTKILSVGIVTANKVYGSFEGDIDGVTLSTFSSSFTASAGVAVGIDTFAKSSYDAAEYTIYFSNGSNIQSQKVLVMDDNTTAFSNEYALMYNTSQIVNISVDVDGSNIKLKATPLAGVSGATNYTWSRTLL